MKRVLTFASAARFDNRDFCVSRGSAGCAYRNQAEGLMRFVQPHAADAAEGSRLLVGGFTGKGMAGHMIHSLLRVPPGLLADLKEPDPTARIFVTLYSGKDSCEIALPSGAGPIGAGTFSHRAFAAEMPSGVLRWRLDRKGRWSAEVREQARILPAEDGRQYARSFGKLPFYPMAKTMPRSLGLALGFIDTAYSLVALEEDAIDDKAEIRYADEGVPTLEPDDIFAAEDEAYDLPLQTWLFMRRTRLEDLRQATAIEAGASFPEGIRFSFADGVLRILVDAALLRGGGALRLSLHDLSGKEIKAWSRADLVGGSIAWSSRQGPHRAGVYLLRVHAAGKTRAAMVRVP